MDSLGQSFSKLETNAEAISVAQAHQGETQKKLALQMEVDMQVASGFLADVAPSATQLQATVSETSSKVQSLAALARVFSALVDWAAIAGVLVLLSIVLAAGTMAWRYSARAVIILLISFCKYQRPRPYTFELSLITVVTIFFVYTGFPISSGDISPQFSWLQSFLDSPLARASLALGFLIGFCLVCCYSGAIKYSRHQLSHAFDHSPFARKTNRPFSGEGTPFT